MATSKVGIYRKYHGPVPTDTSGQPVPESEWPKKRMFRWAVRWFGADGTRYSKSFPSRKEAERFAESKQQEVRDGRADPPPKVTLKEFHAEHLKLMKGNLARGTYRMHAETLKMLAENVGWDFPMYRVTARDIEKLRAKRLETGIAPATANRELRTLKRVFNLAIMRQYLRPDGNPCVGLPMLKVGRKKVPYISPEQFQAIYGKAANTLWQSLLITVYTAGLRLREALNLTWADIDFAGGWLHVARKNASGYVQAWTPKDHELRLIPLPKQALDLLATWQTVAPEGCPYVFMEPGRWQYYMQCVDDDSWGENADLTNNVLRRFKTLCRQAGVGSFVIHDLRRSCITNWVKRLPIQVVKELAGHSDIETTWRYYLAIQESDFSLAKQVQAEIIGSIPHEHLTDPKLTHSAQKRMFPGRQANQPKKEALDLQGLA